MFISLRPRLHIYYFVGLCMLQLRKKHFIIVCIAAFLLAHLYTCMARPNKKISMFRVVLF